MSEAPDLLAALRRSTEDARAERQRARGCGQCGYGIDLQHPAHRRCPCICHKDKEKP